MRNLLLICFLVCQSRSLSAQEDAGTGIPKIPFKKTNRVMLELGGPGSFDECHAKYPCVLRIGDAWWMWYNGRAKDCFTGAIGLATSEDGLSWTKANGGRSVLGTGPRGGPDSTKVDHPAVVNFDGRFHMWYTMGGDRSRYTIGYAISDDGIHWSKQNGGQPVIRPGGEGKFDAEVAMHPCALRTRDGVLHIWYFGRPHRQSGFAIGHATSRDGLQWKKSNGGDPVLTPEQIGGLEELAVYNCYVLRDSGGYHMWYTAAYKNIMNRFAENSGGIRYAHSTNGTKWVKDPAPVFFNGPRGSIDEYSAYAPSVVQRDGALWMYYSIAHLEDVEGDRRRNRVGLAISQQR